MIELHSGRTDEKIVVTLTELQTIENPYYLFVFTHILTKSVVSFVAGIDESPYPERYNEFSVGDVFDGAEVGMWDYIAYEQLSPTNTDPSGLSVLEYGKLILYAATEFEYTKYDTPTSYKSYGG